MSEPAAALTLGELTIQSAVGQRFRGSVNYQLSPEDGLAEDCSKLSILAPNNDLPGLGQASLRLRSKERGGQILIQSADAVYEPMASFSIRMECKGQQLQRSYTVFLDPAPLTAPVVEETQTNIRPPATSTPSRARRSSATPVKAAAKTTESQTTTHSTHKAVEAPPPPPIGNGQLRIESELSIKNQPPAVLSPEELKTKIAMMQSLQEQLQSEMIRLQQSMLHLQALSGASAPASGVNPKPTAAAAATLNISTMDTPAPSEAPEPIAPKRVKVDEAPGNSWWMAAVLAALAAAAGAGLWLRRRQAQNTWDSDAESLLSQVSHSAVKVIKPTDAMEEHSLFRHSQLFYGGIEVQEEEDGSATLERAQLLVAQGETDQAIELLYQTIDENEADNEPWLLLFRVLRQQGMKTEYAQLARRFHDLEGDADDWALVRNIGYRLDPDNPLYSAHEVSTEPAIEEISPEEPASPVEEEVITAEAAVVAEPLSGQDAMLMEFLSTPAEIEPEAKPIVSTPQVISLDLPPLEFSPPDEENSALDISLLDEEETIEASLPLEEAEPIEEIDLVELEIELQPPLSVFEPRKH